MAYGIVHHFPGGTKEQYEASLAAVHPGPDRLPEGQVFHAAGAAPGGWTILAVHDTQESWGRFRDGILLFAQPGALPAPALEQVIEAVKDADMDEIRAKIAEQEKAFRQNPLGATSDIVKRVFGAAR